MHNPLFCSHTLCMSYVTNTFLLVISSARSKQLLCFVHGQGQKREQKHTTKNFVEFHNHSPLLTMTHYTENNIRNIFRSLAEQNLDTGHRPYAISPPRASESDVARGEMFTCSKLGQNLSEMEVRTLVRIQRVIWDHLLASKAEVIQKQGLF